MSDDALPILGIGVLLWALAHWMPRLTRPDLFFAATVPPGYSQSEEAQAITRRYRLWIAFHAVIGISIGIALARTTLYGPLAAMSWQGLGGFAAFYQAHRRALQNAVEPTTVREAALAPRRERLPGGWPLQLLPIAALAATGLYLRSRWADLPASLPVHWGLDGQPDQWAPRTPLTVYQPLLSGALAVALLALGAWALLHQSRPIRVEGQAGEAESRFRRTIVALLLGGEGLLTASFIWTALLPLAKLSASSARGLALTPTILTLLFVAVVLATLIRLGQGGSRLASVPPGDASSGKAAPIGDRTQDRFWKAGLFYVNRNDPALFLEKRFGIGYTVNFGHPGAWVIVGVLVAAALVSWWMGR